jgi:Xaa-Pro aminopeptidase
MPPAISPGEISMTAFLVYGDTLKNANMLYVAGFFVPDPVFYVKSDSGETLAVSPLEESRARKESRCSDVRSFESLGYQQALDETGNALMAMARSIEALLRDHGVSDIEVEPGFPVFLADALRNRGLKITPNADLLVRERRHKSQAEVEAIQISQTRSEQAISQAIDVVREANVVGDTLVYRGVPLTAERLRAEIETSLMADNFASEATIVAPGPGGSDPHWVGAGPIKPHVPIVMDFFPSDRSSRYCGDITRTICKGEPDDIVVRMFEAVQKAHTVALDMIAPGVNGRDVHEAVLAALSDAGFQGETGPRMNHGTGHGVGLEVHEPPRMGRVYMPLEEGDVVTVEPGLYDPKIGGVRLEDMVYVTGDGNRNFNSLPKYLVVQ